MIKTTASFEKCNEIDNTLKKIANKCNKSIRKRLFDITFSLLLFICVFSWLFPLIAILIKLTSKGPVFFKQIRHGLNEKDIPVYKFRTMVTNAPLTDQNGRFIQAVKNDSRVTTIGKFLRKTSIDELPQFWNVIIGDMSVVGPRPHLEHLKDHFDDDIRNYYLRTLVRPGITGLAQVKGLRGGTHVHHLMQDRINTDVEYVASWSFGLDLKIVFYTIYIVLTGHENAY